MTSLSFSFGVRLFREEDRDKRNEHVKDYINKHSEEGLMKEYDLKKNEE